MGDRVLAAHPRTRGSLVVKQREFSKEVIVMGGCCGSGKTKKDKYKCESCGFVSDKSGNCCGKPMKKQ